MILKSEKVLDSFRAAGRCLGCGKPDHGFDPHHVLGKGAGGSDVSWNLAPLCRECHDLVHADPDFRGQVEERVALREQTTVAAIREARSFIQRLPKGLSLERIELHMRELSIEAAALVARAFAETDE